MKIYGENILVGGSGGYLGVGVLGKATGIRGNWTAAHRKVLYCIGLDSKMNLSSSSSSSSTSAIQSHSSSRDSNDCGEEKFAFPHSSEASVMAIAVCHTTDCFSAIDSSGVVSFWQLPKSDGKLGDAPDFISYWTTAICPEVKLQNISKCYK